ncbi:hypothetical protein [Sphaerothrix gracilis]|uniref:hypothetical protein n=1 Tax=Sphaerothrix gracilis TaxID=3151835 RepID=UPI0031FBDCE6
MTLSQMTDAIEGKKGDITSAYERNLLPSSMELKLAAGEALMLAWNAAISADNEAERNWLEYAATYIHLALERSYEGYSSGFRPYELQPSYLSVVELQNVPCGELFREIGGNA